MGGVNKVERHAERLADEDQFLDREQAWHRYERGNRRANRTYVVEDRLVDHRYAPHSNPADQAPDPRYT